MATKVVSTVVRLSAVVRQLSCRHDYLRRAACGRIWLECLECQHATVGVEISTRAA